MRAAVLLLALVAACGKRVPNEAPHNAGTSSPRTEPVKVGDRITPINGPIAIPVKGAKLTLVNYFATWCGSSQRWLPHVEEMRKKYAAAGLAVVAVANTDDAPQAALEDFVKRGGGTFPVSADRDHRILDTIPPSGWGQAIVVVDAQGVVRLVHRGTREGVFDQVDAEVGRLLAQ